MNILVTGATGNMGAELIKQLLSSPGDLEFFAGVRDPERAEKANTHLKSVEMRVFDFERSDSFDGALEGMDIVFLLRPPHISDINRYFKPLIGKIAAKKGMKVVLLSVQGAEKSKIIPHRKIELLLENYGIDHVFLRPSYFMQNLTTTLYREIAEEKTITLPSGTAKFNWIAIEDIARVGAECLKNFDDYRNTALTITGTQNLSFPEVIRRINEIAPAGLQYHDVSPPAYFLKKRKEGIKPGMIMVMLILHFLPKLQEEPEITETYKGIFQEDPQRIEDFIERNRDKFL